MVPSFMSITAPTVRRKGRPKIIGQEGSHSMSIIVKSTGTELSLTMIRTSSIFPKGFFTEESTRRTPKEEGSKGFNSSISYILLGITEVLAPTSQRAKKEKLFNLILIIGSQPSSSFLGMEASTLSFSSLDLIRSLVICSVKARLSVLVWGSLEILCRKPITSGRVQLSKSRSLPSIKEVVISLRLTCLKGYRFIEVSSSTVEVVASPFICPGGLGV